MEITPAQFRAARALLGLKRSEVAKKAGVDRRTVDRLENALGRTPGRYQTAAAIRVALERAGVRFVSLGGPGVQIVARSADVSDV